MFGRRCTLCGGKLDSHNICTECGLDNNKSEKNYRINQSNCDDLPLTHVHRETYQEPRREEPRRTVQKSSAEKQRQTTSQGTFGQLRPQQQMYTGQKKRSGCMTCVVVLIVAVVILVLVGLLAGGVFESGTEYGSYSVETDPYAYVEEELPETGESVEVELPSGRYIVGLHIPSGKYTADPKGEYDSIQVRDSDQGIYLYEYRGDTASEESFLDDLRLYPGAVVIISAQTPVPFTSDNAQTGDLEAGMENPLTQRVEVGEDQMLEAGVDFEPGTYDIQVASGSGSVNIAVPDETGETWGETYLSMGGDYGSDGTLYQNYIFPEGGTIHCDEGITVTLTPSKMIQSENYYEDYMNSY